MNFFRIVRNSKKVFFKTLNLWPIAGLQVLGFLLLSRTVQKGLFENWLFGILQGLVIAVFCAASVYIWQKISVVWKQETWDFYKKIKNWAWAFLTVLIQLVVSIFIFWLLKAWVGAWNIYVATACLLSVGLLAVFLIRSILLVNIIKSWQLMWSLWQKKTGLMLLVYFSLIVVEGVSFGFSQNEVEYFGGGLASGGVSAKIAVSLVFLFIALVFGVLWLNCFLVLGVLEIFSQILPGEKTPEKAENFTPTPESPGFLGSEVADLAKRASELHKMC